MLADETCRFNNHTRFVTGHPIILYVYDDTLYRVVIMTSQYSHCPRHLSLVSNPAPKQAAAPPLRGLVYGHRLAIHNCRDRSELDAYCIFHKKVMVSWGHQGKSPTGNLVDGVRLTLAVSESSNQPARSY